MKNSRRKAGMKRDRRARRDDEELKKIAGARKGYSAGNAGREEPLHYGHEGLTLRDSGLTVRAGLFNFVSRSTVNQKVKVKHGVVPVWYPSV